MSMQECQSRLIRVLDGHPVLAIAVSGGVDSMVLAYLAHRFSRTMVQVLHAVSPAVPALATERVKRYAAAEGWSLRCIDAGELADGSYAANPVDRCYYCKSNLYNGIRAVIEPTTAMASGTNLDDLSDYRPGLEAARTHGVVHPFVEAELNKSDIYALAREHGLTDLSALPAQPCLASRIETGISISADSLRFIEAVENDLASLLPAAGPIRCRLTAKGVFVECGCPPEGEDARKISDHVARLCSQNGQAFAGMRSYRRGSAFVRPGLA